MRSDRLRLQDILDAIDEVARHLPIDQSIFNSNPLPQSHIYRNVMIVGEAACRLSPTLKASSPSIEWRRIEGMRHVMVHDSFRVDWHILYRTARDHVPALRPTIEAMLASFPPESP